MPMRVTGLDQIKNKLSAVLSNMRDDNAFIGGAVAESIVASTLAGIGEGDAPFSPYSAGYKEEIDAVGGKPRQVVDLRGVFYHAGQKRSRSKRDVGQGRRGKVTRGFATFPQGGRDNRLVHFDAQTRETRPQRGLVDPLSEMSLDLIRIEATDDGATLKYVPRAKPYMLLHQDGSGTAPARPWFSADKSAVRAAARTAAETVIRARVQWFNAHSSSGRPPHQQRPPAA